MPRLSTPLALLLVLSAGSLAFFIYYGQWFPPQMAIHFNWAGEPDGWVDRVKFIVIGTSLCFMVPPLLVACVGVMPRVLPASMVNLPHRDYWLAPERRELTLGRLMFFALWLGVIVQGFLFAVFIFLARANPAEGPVHLSQSHVVLAVVFLVLLAAWGLKLTRAFQRSR
jgi:uncharacterized membrane protein